jgi:TonB family protein
MGSFFASSAFAITTTAPQSVTFEKPAPVKTAGNIQLPQRHEGATVTVSMTVDENGKPRNVRVLDQGDQSQYKSLVAAVSKWEFSPARKNGKAVSTRVELPLEVVEPKRG